MKKQTGINEYYMIKIRTLTICSGPGGGGHIVLWKGIKKHANNNAEYYT